MKAMQKCGSDSARMTHLVLLKKNVAGLPQQTLFVSKRLLVRFNFSLSTWGWSEETARAACLTEQPRMEEVTIAFAHAQQGLAMRFAKIEENFSPEDLEGTHKEPGGP